MTLVTAEWQIGLLCAIADRVVVRSNMTVLTWCVIQWSHGAQSQVMTSPPVDKYVCLAFL